MQVSEFIILGLGGVRYWQQHAKETAKVLKAVNPDKIRVLTIGIKPGSNLEKKWKSGSFTLPTEMEIITEQRLMLSHLGEVTSHYANHHSIDLLLEARGQLPGDKKELISIMDRFLNLPQHDRQNFILGRRIGAYRRLDDLQNSLLYQSVDQKLDELGYTSDEQLESVFHSLRVRVI